MTVQPSPSHETPCHQLQPPEHSQKKNRATESFLKKEGKQKRQKRDKKQKDQKTKSPPRSSPLSHLLAYAYPHVLVVAGQEASPASAVIIIRRGPHVLQLSRPLRRRGCAVPAPLHSLGLGLVAHDSVPSATVLALVVVVGRPRLGTVGGFGRVLFFCGRLFFGAERGCFPVGAAGFSFSLSLVLGRNLLRPILILYKTLAMHIGGWGGGWDGGVGGGNAQKKHKTQNPCLLPINRIA